MGGMFRDNFLQRKNRLSTRRNLFVDTRTWNNTLIFFIIIRHCLYLPATNRIHWKKILTQFRLLLMDKF